MLNRKDFLLFKKLIAENMTSLKKSQEDQTVKL